MFFDFHTHIPSDNALVSSPERPSGGIWWSLEVHPWHLPEKFVEFTDGFFSKLETASALGEIGLDRLRGPDISVQLEYLKHLLQAAEKFSKPVVIHSVRCDMELDSALKAFSGRVLIHGFRGGEKRLLHHLEQGRFISFAPGAWREHSALLKQRGLKNIGLETDEKGDIAMIYQAAERETGISGWEKVCEENFLRFIGIG